MLLLLWYKFSIHRLVGWTSDGGNNILENCHTYFYSISNIFPANNMIGEDQGAVVQLEKALKLEEIGRKLYKESLKLF